MVPPREDTIITGWQRFFRRRKPGAAAGGVPAETDSPEKGKGPPENDESIVRKGARRLRRWRGIVAAAVWVLLVLYLVSVLAGWGGETWQSRLTSDGFIAAVAVVAYLLVLLGVRWLLIAKPYRESLQAEIDILRARMCATGQPAAVWRRQAEQLLVSAERQLDEPDPFFWSWGDQKAAAQLIAGAESLAAHALTATEARHRLDVVLNEIGRYSNIDTQVAPAIQRFQTVTQRLERERIPPSNGSEPQTNDSEEYRMLHSNALAVLHRLEIAEFARILKWHRKVLWITVSGLILLVMVAIFLQNGELLVVGAVGAYLSRLTRIIRRADAQPEDVSSYWTNLLLGPLLGALAAYGGVLLIVIFRELGLAGEALDAVTFQLDGVTPDQRTITLSLGFAFGITEGLVNRIASGVDAALTGKPDPSEISSSSTKSG